MVFTLKSQTGLVIQPLVMPWKYVCQAKNLMNEKTNGVQWLMNGQFSIKQYYQLLMRGNMQVVWARYVWNRCTIPKHRLIMWLAIQDRLKTRQRPKIMNVCVNDQCLLCQQHPETINHLLFDCKFSELCLSEVLQWLGIPWRQRNLVQLCRWTMNRYKGNRTRKMVLLAATTATVYVIWRNRNSSQWDQVVMTVSKAVQDIKMNVKQRIIQC